MSSRQLREKLDSIRSRNRQGPESAIETYYSSSRQQGHTEASIRVAKMLGARILAWNEQHAQSIRGRCGMNSGVVVADAHAPAIRSDSKPLVIDHYVVQRFMYEKNKLVDELTETTAAYIAALEGENKSMRERLSTVSADLESYKGRYVTLTEQMEALAASAEVVAAGVRG